MTIQEVEKYLIFKTISGSHLHGTNIEGSDIDYRGIYVLPNEYLFGLNTYVDQVSDDTNDITYYELNRFMELIFNQNPNVLEILWAKSHLKNNIIISPAFITLFDNRHKLLSKQCKDTFGGYAISQIKKARGLNKKIVNPVDKEKKTPLDFCHVFLEGKSIELKHFLNNSGYDPIHCGLAAYSHGKDCYSLYYDHSHSGILRGICFDDSSSVHLSSIPKELPFIASMVYNADGYSKYCKDYKEYWEWVDKRNPLRYCINTNHGKGYDGKNLMHCIRLLEMALEIADTGELNVKRPNRDFLLSIRFGEMEYDDILKLAESKISLLNSSFEKSNLPDKINNELINHIIYSIRKKY